MVKRADAYSRARIGGGISDPVSAASETSAVLSSIPARKARTAASALAMVSFTRGWS